MSERIEYAIRWAEGVPGLRDVSTPHESRPMVEMALEGSAFDGVIIQRTVTESDWEDSPETAAMTMASETGEGGR